MKKEYTFYRGHTSFNCLDRLSGTVFIYNYRQKGHIVQNVPNSLDSLDCLDYLDYLDGQDLPRKSCLKRLSKIDNGNCINADLRYGEKDIISPSTLVFAPIQG